MPMVALAASLLMQSSPAAPFAYVTNQGDNTISGVDPGVHHQVVHPAREPGYVAGRAVVQGAGTQLLRGPGDHPSLLDLDRAQAAAAEIEAEEPAALADGVHRLPERGLGDHGTGSSSRSTSPPSPPVSTTSSPADPVPTASR